jgi:hypothetical protein
MGLFSKDVALDSRLAPLLRPATNDARKMLARYQPAVLEALAEDVGAPVMIGCSGLTTIGVITDNWLLEFHGGILLRRVQLSNIAGSGVTQEADYQIHARAEPGIDFTFRTFEDANAFLIKLDRRDIPKLYPDYYVRILQALGYSADAENMLNLIQRVANMIWAGGANAYFAQTQEADGQRVFALRFGGEHSYEQWLSIPDDMIDFLWEWAANFHPPLRGLVAESERLLTGEHGTLRGHPKFPSMADWHST